MKKLLLLIVAIAFGAAIANSQTSTCTLPYGVDPTGWKSGTPVEFKWKVDTDYNGGTQECWVTVEYCYKDNGDDPCQILLGSITYTCVTYDQWGNQQPCDTENTNSGFCQGDNDTREVILDKLIYQIWSQFNDDPNGPAKCIGWNTASHCDSGEDPVTSVILLDVSCDTGSILFPSGAAKTYPCGMSGYCKYEYSFCWKVTTDGLDPYYTRTGIIGSDEPCPGYEIIDGNSYPCYPKGTCYNDRLHISFDGLGEDVLENDETVDDFYHDL